LEGALSLLGEELADFTFIDLGCGKGRVLVAASRMGFRRIVGVEFAPELADTARINLAKLGLKEVEIVQGDAAEYDFPDSNLVVYLFNPFSGEVLRGVVEKLRNLLTRRIFIVYNSPKCAEVLDSSGFLRRFGPPMATRWTIQIWERVSC
jgi:precorrin-6B methylase 2